MGLVSQEPALFATTIKENILFGKEDADMEEVIVAAKASNAHNFICQLPQGYDTKVGDRGIQMSRGQKQIIAIARAIIKGPRVLLLLLDEATGALDSGSERIVQEAIDKAAMDCTTIITVPCLSTVRNANLVDVVHSGQIMETGSHDELIQDEKQRHSIHECFYIIQYYNCENQDDERSGSTNSTALSQRERECYRSQGTIISSPVVSKAASYVYT